MSIRARSDWRVWFWDTAGTGLWALVGLGAVLVVLPVFLLGLTVKWLVRLLGILHIQWGRR